MAWQQVIEQFPGQWEGVVYELFDEDLPRYKEAEQQVRDEIASHFEAERHLGQDSKWWKHPDLPPDPFEGWPWPVNSVPYRYKMSEPLLSNFDIDYFITEKAIRAIESVEPGIHRYLPVDCYLPDGSLFERRWKFNCCSRLDTIAFEHSPDLKRVGVGGGAYRYLGAVPPNPRIALWKDRVSGRSLWHEYKWQKYLMSDEMLECFKSNDIHGLTASPTKRLTEI